MIKDKVGFSLRLIALLLCAFFIASRMVTESLAKYSTSATSFDSARVARFISVKDDISTTGSVIFDTTIVMNPGDQEDVTFKIVNNGETSVNLLLEVSSTNNLPLPFYFNGSEVSTINFDMNVGDTVEVTFKMKWAEELNDFKYSNLVDNVCVVATCEQID